MMQDFGVSRHTVRLALQSLIADRMIERYPGKGTFVARNSDTKAVWTVRGLDDIIYDTLDIRREVRFIGNVRASNHPAAARAFRATETAELFMLHIMRYSPSGPYGSSNVFLPISLAIGIPEKEFERGTVGRAIERHHRVRLHQASVLVSAELADSHVSRLLGVNPGDAILVMEQTFYSRANETLQFTQAQYVPGRRLHLIEFQRNVKVES